MMNLAKNDKVPSSVALAKHIIFVCPECGVKSETQQEWRKHLNGTHDYANKTAEGLDFVEIDNKFHECQICKQRIAYAHQTPVILQYHRFTHMRYSPYKCRYCPTTYVKKRTLCVHIFRHHRRLINSLERQRMDPKYNKEFFIRYLCPQCGKLFDQSKEWEKHIDEAHISTSTKIGMHRIDGTNDYYCDQCSYTIKNRPSWNELRRHHFSHLPRPDYFKCAFCTTRMSLKTKLYSHFLIRHKDKYFEKEMLMCSPQEWGVTSCNEKEMTAKNKSGATKKIDILQKALLKSSIDLEGNDTSDSEMDSKNELIMNTNCYKNNVDMILEDDELEQIYKEMFEEITETECYSDDFYNKKDQHPKLMLEFSERLRQEMLKYISYLCPICLKEFFNQPAWRSHVFEFHNLEKDVKSKFRPLNVNKTAFICLICNQIQRTSKHSDLQRHHFQHMPYQDYLKCTICMDTKASKTRIFQHMKYVHRIQVDTDDDDNDDIKGNGIRLKVTFENNLNCLECDAVFKNTHLLQIHYKTCPSRLVPIAVGQYDVAKNKQLLKHLQNASRHIDNMLSKNCVDANSIKFNYK